MNQLDKDILMRNRVFLVKQIVPLELLDHLEQERIFTNQMAERVRSKATTSEKNRTILDDLTRRGPDAYQAFLRSLQASSQDHVYQTLISFGDELMARSKLSNKLSEGGPPPPVQRQLSSGYGTANAALNYSTPVQATDEDPPSGYHYSQPRSQQQPEARVQIQQSQPAVTQNVLHTRDPSLCYPIGNPPGRLIIISNKSFPNSPSLPQRLGVENDTNRLKDTFQLLGYQVADIVTFSDLSKYEMQTELTKFITDPRTHRASSVICMISSHGESGAFYGRDGALLEETAVINMFDRDNAPSLKHKPKLFLFQACRGGARDEVAHDGPGDEADSVKRPSTPAMATAGNVVADASEKVHRLGDMLFANATVAGEVAMRNTITGSWFVQALCDVITEHYKRYHIIELLTFVVSRVNTMGGNHVQLPSPTSHLSKFWYLI